jgi:hypothetical protein
VRASFVFGRIPLSASAGEPAVNRMEPVAMFHFPLKGFLITDKNRADLDWSSGSFNWRYRNRLTAERRLTIHSYHPGLAPAQKPSTKAHSQSGLPLAFMQAACCLQARTSNLIRTTSTRTTQERVRTSKKTLPD